MDNVSVSGDTDNSGDTPLKLLPGFNVGTIVGRGLGEVAPVWKERQGFE